MTTSHRLISALLMFGFLTAAQAQVTNPNSHTPTGIGGTASSGTGVRTGTGALSQPVAPAASLLNNNQQNLQGSSQRPLNSSSPVQTFPSQQPFGH